MATLPRQENGMRIEIDHELCSGSGYCVRVAPEVFELRDDKSNLRAGVTLADIDPQRLERAARACPWQAIRLSAGES